jgi:ubiquitin C-terminal hydrolase
MDNSQEDVNLKGVVGIQNMGNTCYCNTTLQLIRACSEWNVFCLTQNFIEQLKEVSDENPNKRMLLAYQDILKALWSAHRPAYVRPLGFISEVRKAVIGTPYEMFGIPVPNDSHEYLVYLLDHFHEALKTEYEEKKIDESMSSVMKMRIMAENGWNRYLSKNKSEVVHYFFGMLRKTIHCTNCNNKTYQWEVFNTLKVPCDGLNFNDWIRKEVNEESQIENYRCDNCNTKSLAKISAHLWRLPPHLFVTLRRFHFNGMKNMTPCPYNGDPLSLKDCFAEEAEDSEKEWIYELRGVSDHHGTHMGGHYTAQFKHPISGQWWWFDDEQSRPLESPQFSSSNYIFFFKKV